MIRLMRSERSVSRLCLPCLGFAGSSELGTQFTFSACECFLTLEFGRGEKLGLPPPLALTLSFPGVWNSKSQLKEHCIPCSTGSGLLYLFSCLPVHTQPVPSPDFVLSLSPTFPVAAVPAGLRPPALLPHRSDGALGVDGSQRRSLAGFIPQWK